MRIPPISALLQYAEWDWQPSILIGLVLLSVGYILICGPLRNRNSWGRSVSPGKKVAFFSGLLIVFLALCSPIDELGDEYLFSAHMLQHMLLMVVAPPLWLLGIPDWLFARAFSKGFWKRAFLLFTAPATAFLLYTSVMWLWHLPSAYNATLEHEWLHILEHLTFMAAGVIGWLPAFSGHPSSRPTAVRSLYLALLTLPSTGLAALLVFPNQVLYSFYAHAPQILGIDHLADQQAGGLIMWATDMIILIPAIVLFGRWLAEQEQHPGSVGR